MPFDLTTFSEHLTALSGVLATVIKFLIDLIRPVARRHGWTWFGPRSAAIVLGLLLAAVALLATGASLRDAQTVSLVVLGGLGGAKGAMLLTDRHDQRRAQTEEPRL